MPTPAIPLPTVPPSVMAAMLDHWRRWAKQNARRVRELTDQAWQATSNGPAEGRLGRATALLAERLCSALVADQEERARLLQEGPHAMILHSWEFLLEGSLPWREIARGLLARGWQRP